MDGIHDLGGRHGFGPVAREADEPAFHARWEAKVFAMMRAAGAAGVVRSADQFRHAIERIEPVAYLTHGYYGRWLGGIETLLREAGVLDEAALRARVQALGGDPDAPAAARPAAHPDRPAAAGDPGAQRTLQTPPRFAVGERVRTMATGSAGHTRLPGYARGRDGIVIARHGGWVFPDTNAHGLGERPQHLYTVEFAAETLWGADAEPGVSVTLDLFEAYLEHAHAAATE